MHPSVGESAVFGVPHADFGEMIVAALVAAPDCEIDLLALEAEITAKLARFKHPKRYQILPELPRNAMGKVQKNVLRDTYH